MELMPADFASQTPAELQLPPAQCICGLLCWHSVRKELRKRKPQILKLTSVPPPAHSSEISNRISQ